MPMVDRKSVCGWSHRPDLFFIIVRNLPAVARLKSWPVTGRCLG
jgi:hypothetical protein